MHRFVKLKPFLVELFARDEWSRKPGLVKAKFREADWDLMDKLVSVLQVYIAVRYDVFQRRVYCAPQVFYEATLQMSHSSSCISEVVPVVTILLDALSRGTNDAGIIGYKFNLRSKLRESMGDFEKNLNYAMATLVDPRYKDTFFQDSLNVEAAKEELVSLIKAELPHGEDIELAQPDMTTSVGSIGEVEKQDSSIMGMVAKRIRLNREQQVRDSTIF